MTVQEFIDKLHAVDPNKEIRFHNVENPHDSYFINLFGIVEDVQVVTLDFYDE